MSLLSRPQYLFFLLLSNLLLSVVAQELEKEIITLFAHIEGEQQETIEKATQKLISIGVKALPYIEKRLEKTGLPRYMYVLKQITLQKEKNSKWNKENYFRKRYKEATQLLKDGYPKEAIEIAQAILVLEPEISLTDNLKQLIRDAKAKHFSQSVLQAKVVAPKKLYNFSEKITLTFALVNQTPSSVVVDTQKKKIVLQITINNYDLVSHRTVDVRTKIITLPSKLEIPGVKQWSAKFSIENPAPAVVSYRELLIEARIPLVRVVVDRKTKHPHIVFPPFKIPVMPKSFHSAAVQPMKNFSIALKLSKPYYLFYLSFFIAKHQQTDVIELLIQNLENMDKKTLVISFGILRRLTRKNFPSIFRWKNWWLAQRTPK